MPPQLRTRRTKQQNPNPDPNHNPITKPETARGRRGRPARNRNIAFARDDQIDDRFLLNNNNEENEPHVPPVRFCRDIKQDIMDDDCGSGGRSPGKAPVAEDEGSTPPIPEKVIFSSCYHQFLHGIFIICFERFIFLLILMMIFVLIIFLTGSSRRFTVV